MGDGESFLYQPVESGRGGGGGLLSALKNKKNWQMLDEGRVAMAIKKTGEKKTNESTRVRKFSED